MLAARNWSKAKVLLAGTGISATASSILFLFSLLLTALCPSAFAISNHEMALVDKSGKEIIPFKYTGIIAQGHGLYIAFQRAAGSKKIISRIFNTDGQEVSHTVPGKYKIDKLYFPDAVKLIEPVNALPRQCIFAVRSDQQSGLFSDGKFIEPLGEHYFSSARRGFIPVFKKHSSEIAFAIEINSLRKETDPEVLKTLRYDYKRSSKRQSGWYSFSVRQGKRTLWGYKDSNGEVRIQPQYFYAGPFGERDRAMVRFVRKDGNHGKAFYINKSGSLVSPCYDFIIPAYGAYSVCRNDTKYSLVDEKFKPVLKDYAYLAYLYDDVFAMRKSPGDRMEARTLDSKRVFTFPSDAVHVSESNGLVYCAVKDPAYDKFKSTFNSSVCMNRYGKVVFDSRGYERLSLKDGVVVLRSKHGAYPLCVIVDKTGPIFGPFKASSVSKVGENRYLLWRRDKRFYSHEWKADASGYQRPEMFANLLGEYDLIGLEREKLEELLGQPEKSNNYPREFYRVGYGGCTRAQPFLEFEFRNGKVKAWRMNTSRSWNYEPAGEWVTRNMIYHWPDSMIARIGESHDFKLYPKPKKSRSE